MDVAAAKKLCDAATPGPWKPLVWIETDGNEWRATGPGHDDETSDEGSEPGCPDEQAAQRDAEFIAASRQLVPALLAEVERLRRFLDDACRIGLDCADSTSDVGVQLRAIREEAGL